MLLLVFQVSAVIVALEIIPSSNHYTNTLTYNIVCEIYSYHITDIYFYDPITSAKVDK